MMRLLYFHAVFIVLLFCILPLQPIINHSVMASTGTFLGSTSSSYASSSASAAFSSTGAASASTSTGAASSSTSSTGAASSSASLPSTSSPTAAATIATPTTSSASATTGGSSSSGVNTSYVTTAVAVSVIGAILSGIIATLFWKFRQLNELAKERSKKPLAAYVFRSFSLFEYRDFDSNDGRAFVTMMNHIDFQILRTFHLSRDASSASSPSGVEQLDMHRERLIHATLCKKMRKLGVVVPTKMCYLRMCCCCLQAYSIEPDTLNGPGSLAKQQQIILETVALLKMEAAFSHVDVHFDSVAKPNSTNEGEGHRLDGEASVELAKVTPNQK